MLASSNYSCLLTFQVAGPMPSMADGLESASCRKLVQDRYLGEETSKAFSQSAGGHMGPAFDLKWTNSERVTQSARVVVIPSAAGVLEFILLASPDKFTDGQYFSIRSYCPSAATKEVDSKSRGFRMNSVALGCSPGRVYDAHRLDGPFVAPRLHT